MTVITPLPHVSLSSLFFPLFLHLPPACHVPELCCLPCTNSRLSGHCCSSLFPFGVLWAERRREHHREKAELTYPWGTTMSCTPTLQTGFGVGTPSRHSSCTAACGGVAQTDGWGHILLLLDSVHNSLENPRRRFCILRLFQMSCWEPSLELDIADFLQ